MLIAKYVKVFSRTGTLPSHLGCCFRLDFGPSPKAMGAVLGPLVPPRPISRRILRIKNALGVLAYSNGNHARLDSAPGLAKLWTFCPVLGKPFPRLPQKGKETVKKYTAGNMGSKKRFPAVLHQPG